MIETLAYIRNMKKQYEHMRFHLGYHLWNNKLRVFFTINGVEYAYYVPSYYDNEKNFTKIWDEFYKTLNTDVFEKAGFDLIPEEYRKIT